MFAEANQMTKAAGDEQLTEQDLSIILDVLRVNQSMELTAYAVKLIERELTYPFHSLDGFLRIFSDRNVIRLASRTIEADQVERFLTKKSFPIANREELISRLVMAFERERMSEIFSVPVESGKDAEERPGGE
jgi:hypothetical protein